jgi:hypothetical protein
MELETYKELDRFNAAIFERDLTMGKVEARDDY